MGGGGGGWRVKMAVDVCVVGRGDNTYFLTFCAHVHAIYKKIKFLTQVFLY